MKIHTVKGIAALLSLLLLLSTLAACTPSEQPNKTSEESTATTEAPSASEEPTEAPTEEATTEEVDLEHLTLIKDGVARYEIVRPDKDDTMIVNSALLFRQAFQELAGVDLKLTNDFVPRGEEVDNSKLEILIGDTNRKASIDAMAKLQKYQFIIEVVGNQLVIAGHSPEVLYEGMEYFIEQYLNDTYFTVAEGEVKMKREISYQSDGSSHAFETLLYSSDTLNSTCEVLYTIPRPTAVNSNAKTLQGGYSDGTYYYQAFIQKDTASNEKSNKTYIVKYEMATQKVVKISGDLGTNHSNDITLDTKNNRLVVCHNNPNRKKLSFVDPDTLEVIGTKDISVSIYSIDYNASRNQYVVGISGGQTFCILDENFNAVTRAFQPTDRTAGYTTQGVAVDDHFIYFVLWKENVITVYNWSGQFVTLITLNVGNIEPENLSVVNETIYVACSSSGAKIFKVTPIKKESAD